MIDHCQNCVFKGDMEACRPSGCSNHNSWYASELKKEIATLKAERDDLLKRNSEIGEFLHESIGHIDNDHWCESAGKLIANDTPVKSAAELEEALCRIANGYDDEEEGSLHYFPAYRIATEALEGYANNLTANSGD